MPSFLRRLVSPPTMEPATATTEESRPEALPSRLSKKFGGGPALGTVVVDEHFPGLADLESKMAQSVFEIVEPQVASSSSTPASSSSVEKSGAPQRRRVVRQGGLVLFSAAFLEAHPQSPAARLAKSYEHTYAYNRAQLKDELVCDKAAPVAPTADDKEKQEAEKLAEVQLEVYSAELGCLPLFRFRSDDDVYGRACYIRRDTQAHASRPAVAAARPQLSRTAYSSSSSLSDGDESVTEHIVASPTSPSVKKAFPEVHIDASARLSVTAVRA